MKWGEVNIQVGMGMNMWVSSRRRYRYRLGVIILPLIGGWLLFQSSCTTLWPTRKEEKTAVAEKEPAKTVVPKWDEYAVHILKGGETPATLAEMYLGDKKTSWVIEDANEGIPYEKDRAIVIPLKEKNRGGLRKDGYQIVPVLCYHHFSEHCKSSLCIPGHIFDRQMKYLKDNGYRVLSLKELLGFLQYRHALPKRSVIITIDDGYRSAYGIAYPILKKYGFTATLFVYTNFIGHSNGALTWDQLKAMKDDGFEVGSHTLSHVDLTKKKKGEDDQAYLARVKKELLLSKQKIDKRLGQDTIYLSFPYGGYNHRILRICEQMGYEMAFLVKGGGNPFFADPLFLRRDQILGKDMEAFISRLKTFQRLSLE